LHSNLKGASVPTEPDYTGLVAAQRDYFLAGHTRPLAWRVSQLKALKAMFVENRPALYNALYHDLRRNTVDADLMDIEFCVRDADHALAHIHEWVKPQHVKVPPALKPGHAVVRRDPLGVTLIIAPWNEPLELMFSPLVPALAAGNTAVLKPSEISAATSSAIAELAPHYFDTQAVAVVEGAVPETTALLKQRWDMIFFTGSPEVGKIVHAAAAKNLTPCVLELGGKNPTIVHSSANLRVAARRIAFGRYANGGQICTAPDHVLVWPDVKEEFIEELRAAVLKFWGQDPRESPDYGRVINRKAFDRLVDLLGDGKIVFGGQTDADDLYIAPTAMIDAPLDSPVMQEEVFGPILPIVEVRSVREAIDWVNDRPAPLAVYVFAEEADVADRILQGTGSGDAGVNECTIHPILNDFPFGGLGNSGMGRYHGQWGFEAFSNPRGVLYHATAVDPGVRYPPYAKNQRTRKVVAKLM
jgi:aldehyde dehydrogenase (NAD+)